MLALAASALVLLLGPRPAADTPRVRYVSWPEAQPVVAAMATALPADLAGRPPAALEAAWPGWVVARDRELRGRLARGEEDAVVNLLLFGTSFTTASRLTREGTSGRPTPQIEAVLAGRVHDLAAAICRSGGDERVQLARAALARDEPSASPGDVASAERWIIQLLSRARREQAGFAAELARIHALPDASERLAARSSLFRERGIALDTSLRPAFAVERALAAALARGLLSKGAIRRAAVVGPGLDFVDKAEGQDFYPPQSLQCPALADSLVRLGLAQRGSLAITAIDISPRVLDHLRRARRRAAAGEGYRLQLYRPTTGWTAEFSGYWRRFGDAVATPVRPLTPPPSAGPLEVRAVRVRPELLAGLRAVEMNAVCQRLELPHADRFDLVVATNVLVYYGPFEQSLALAGIAEMTKPGGLLLSNDAVPEPPGGAMRSVGYETVVYSDAPDDGERVVFYRRPPDDRP